MEVECSFLFNDTATTEIYTYGHTRSLHDALPIYGSLALKAPSRWPERRGDLPPDHRQSMLASGRALADRVFRRHVVLRCPIRCPPFGDRKSTTLNSSHLCSSRMPSSA